MIHSVLSPGISDHRAFNLLLSQGNDFTNGLTLTKALFNDIINRSIERYYAVSNCSSKIVPPIELAYGYIDVNKVELVLTNIFNFLSKQERGQTIELSITSKQIDNIAYTSIRIPDRGGYYCILDQGWSSPLQEKSIDLGNYFNLIIASTLIECHFGIFEYVNDSLGFAFVVNLPEDHDYYRNKISPQQSVEQQLKELDNIKLIDKATEIITQNVADFGFNIGMLCRELGVSQTSLYRKLQEAIKMSPNQLIRHIRLSEAHKILKTKKYLVAEVAIMVGFKDKRYFSKLFKDTYGVYPVEYLKASSISFDGMLSI